MITISPENPSSADSIFLTVSGSGCTSIASLIDDNPIFTAEITMAEDCFTIPPPYSYSFEIGTLTSGQYTITHRLIDPLGTERFTEQINFNVPQASNAIPPTSVPATSAFSLLMLITLLFAVGKRYFKK